MFTEDNLRFARTYLKELFCAHDARWIRKPFGPLGQQWRNNGPGPACSLIELSRILSRLELNITNRSVPLLEAKIKELLRARDDERFQEILTELQFADFLSHRATPISIDPCVPESLIGTANRPPSPDFAVRLLDADVLFEVTVLRFGALDSWNAKLDRLSAHVTKRVLKEGKRRSIEFAFPFAVRNLDLVTLVSRELIHALLASDAGEWIYRFEDSQATVKWGPIPHIYNGPVGADSSAISSRVNYGTFGPVLFPATATTRRIIADERLDELLVKSVRNTLNRKRQQFPHEGFYLLVARIDHDTLLAPAVHDIVFDRIWPNPDYAWMMGLCIFTPMMEFGKGGKGPHLLLLENPNAVRRLPASLVSMIDQD